MNSGSEEEDDPEVGIRTAAGESENGDNEILTFPDEPLKTLLAFLFFGSSFLVTGFCLALVNETRPLSEPLPDLFLDSVKYLDYGLKVSEFLLLVNLFSAITVAMLHAHRTIIFMRVFLLLGIMYLYRAATFSVTALPIADTNFKCYNKYNGSIPFEEVLLRVVRIAGGGGFNFGEEKADTRSYCGDYIFSGHTVIFITTHLAIKEYTPRNLFLLHWLSMLCAALGVFFLMAGRGHYSVDVLIAYFVTTRLWWGYHTLANTSIKNIHTNNELRNLWWWMVFRYLEKNIPGPVPNRYSLPLPRSWRSYLNSKFNNKQKVDLENEP